MEEVPVQTPIEWLSQQIRMRVFRTTTLPDLRTKVCLANRELSRLQSRNGGLIPTLTTLLRRDTGEIHTDSDLNMRAPTAQAFWTETRDTNRGSLLLNLLVNRCT